MIEDNLRQVQENICQACKRSGRIPQEVKLIAVSKTKPLQMLKEAYEAGVRDFGENKVQELLEKMPLMPEDVRFHMIGHLQRNKVKYIVGKVYMIHSVDSLRLAEEISKEALKKGVKVKILIEVNIAAEESKFGVLREDVVSLMEKIAELPGISVEGLMTIAPLTAHGEDNREYFRRLKHLAVDIKNKNIDNISMNILSMGMTGDYEIAVEEGADYVRVGTGIFGERNYIKEGE